MNYRKCLLPIYYQCDINVLHGGEERRRMKHVFQYKYPGLLQALPGNESTSLIEYLLKYFLLSLINNKVNFRKHIIRQD